MSSRTIKQLFDLTGQVALVTGGSRGLGLQMAYALGKKWPSTSCMYGGGERPHKHTCLYVMIEG